jgi:hypothetical protein
LRNLKYWKAFFTLKRAYIFRKDLQAFKFCKLIMIF